VLLGLVVVVVVLLKQWTNLLGLRHSPRGLVVDGLHWVRVHWLTLGSLGVAVTLLGLGLRRRGDRRRVEREQANRAAEQVRQTAPGQAEHERRDIVSWAALLAEHCWLDPATSWLPRVGDVNDTVALGVHSATAVEDLAAAIEKPTETSAPRPPASVPVYVPRDLDAKLDAALAAALVQGGLVLVREDVPTAVEVRWRSRC
jgi:hypothetical protein